MFWRRRRSVRVGLAGALLVALVLLATMPVLVLTPAAGAAPGVKPGFAPAASATIHPGVQTVTGGGQCTANFIFTDGDGQSYIGQAAHCSSTGSATQSGGCDTPTLPLGTLVRIQGASRPGVLAYNSWVTMQELQESGPNTCRYNDLALVRIDPADASRINPTVPFWGGPTGLNTSGAPATQAVYSYGNSSLRLGLTLLSPKVGISGGDSGGGGSHGVTTVTPGIPGDSGSPFLDAQGNALGILSTLNVGLLVLSTNGVGDLSRELGYLQAHSSLRGVELALGTQPFNGLRLAVL
ncbi:MAG: hypothetical protein NVSMB32_06030 [Actinomycetota bacterium]